MLISLAFRFYLGVPLLSSQLKSDICYFYVYSYFTIIMETSFFTCGV
jgi:hypothetical protein